MIFFLRRGSPKFQSQFLELRAENHLDRQSVVGFLPEGSYSSPLGTKPFFGETPRILPKMMVSGQTGLNMNPLGENRPRSVDPDGSMPAVPKTDFFTFFEKPPGDCRKQGFQAKRA